MPFCSRASPGTPRQSVPTDIISTHDGDIVVTAKPDPEPKARAARAQARAITDASAIFGEPLPLFQQKVCPGVTGLPVDLAQYVANRIRFNAERTGLELAKAGECRPNLLVAFVFNGQRTLAKYAGKGDTILADIPPYERRKLLNKPGPVHAFIIAQDRSRDGMRPQEDPNNQYELIHEQSANSLFLLPTRSEIQMAVVLIDIPAIDGMSAKQLADYATMRGLARTKAVQSGSTYSTILSLFDPDAGHPAELTTFDLAYLRTIYSNAPNLIAAAKLGGVKHEMRKQIEAAAADDQSDN